MASAPPANSYNVGRSGVSAMMRTSGSGNEMSQREDTRAPELADHVDRLRDAWAREWPGLDTGPVAVVARVGRLARHLDRGLERVFAQHGLTREGFDVLAGLRRAG